MLANFHNFFFMRSIVVFVFATIWVNVLLFKRFMTFLLQCFIITFRFFAKIFIVVVNSSFWLAKSDLKIDKKRMIFVKSRCMWLIFLSTRWRSKIFDWIWSLMIKLFKQSKIFKTRVLSIVFWLFFRFRRSCRTWLRRWIQCSFENNVDVTITSSVNHVRKDILDIKEWRRRILKRWIDLKACMNYDLDDYFKSWILSWEVVLSCSFDIFIRFDRTARSLDVPKTETA
jgi:hypothetical protein